MTIYQVSGCMPSQRQVYCSCFLITTRTKQFMKVLVLLLQRFQISGTEQEYQLSSAITSLYIIEKLFRTYCKPKKNKGRMTETRRSYEMEFAASIEELFDIAHEDAMTIDNDGYRRRQTIFTFTASGKKGIHRKD